MCVLYSEIYSSSVCAYHVIRIHTDQFRVLWNVMFIRIFKKAGGIKQEWALYLELQIWIEHSFLRANIWQYVPVVCWAHFSKMWLRNNMTKMWLVSFTHKLESYELRERKRMIIKSQPLPAWLAVRLAFMTCADVHIYSYVNTKFPTTFPYNIKRIRKESEVLRLSALVPTTISIRW